MRMLFSVLALLVVVAVVMKLSASQMQAIGPASSGGQAGAGGPAPADAARRAADLVNKAMEQGAAMRAADAASQ